MAGWTFLLNSVSRTAAVVMMALLLAGCQTPELSGYVESSAKIRTAMYSAGAEYRPYVERYMSREDLDRFDQDWNRFVLASDALLEYAQALGGLATTGRTGADGARAFATSVDGMMSKLGVAGIATGEVTKIAVDLYGLAVQGITGHRLAEAVGQADPYIKAVCRILAERVALKLKDDLDMLLVGTLRDIDDEYPDVSGNYEILLLRRTAILSEHSRNAIGAWPDGVKEELDKINELLAHLQPRYDEYTAKTVRARRIVENQKLLFHQLAVALESLSTEHGTLRATIEANRTFSMQNVQYSFDEVTRVIHRIQEIRDHE